MVHVEEYVHSGYSSPRPEAVAQVLYMRPAWPHLGLNRAWLEEECLQCLHRVQLGRHLRVGNVTSVLVKWKGADRRMLDQGNGRLALGW